MRVKTVTFSTYTTRNLFKLIADNVGCKQIALGEELDDPAVAFTFRGDGHYVSTTSKSMQNHIRITDLPQFEMMPTKEAFLEYLFAWCPDGH